MDMGVLPIPQAEIGLESLVVELQAIVGNTERTAKATEEETGMAKKESDEQASLLGGVNEQIEYLNRTYNFNNKPKYSKMNEKLIEMWDRFRNVKMFQNITGYLKDISLNTATSWLTLLLGLYVLFKTGILQILIPMVIRMAADLIMTIIQYLPVLLELLKTVLTEIMPPILKMLFNVILDMLGVAKDSPIRDLGNIIAEFLPTLVTVVLALIKFWPILAGLFKTIIMPVVNALIWLVSNIIWPFITWIVGIIASTLGVGTVAASFIFAAIVAVIAAIALIGVFWDDLKGKFLGFLSIVFTAITLIALLWRSIIRAFSDAWDFFKEGEILEGLKVLFKSFFAYMWEGIKDMASGIKDFFIWLWDNALSPLFSWIWKGIKWLWDYIKIPFVWIGEQLVSLWDSMVLLWTDFTKFLDKIGKWIHKKVFSPIIGVINTVIRVISNLVNKFKEFFNSLSGKNAAESLKDIGGKLAGFIVNALDSAQSWVVSGFKKVLSGFADVFGKAMDVLLFPILKATRGADATSGVGFSEYMRVRAVERRSQVAGVDTEKLRNMIVKGETVSLTEEERIAAKQINPSERPMSAEQFNRALLAISTRMAARDSNLGSRGFGKVMTSELVDTQSR